LFKLIVVLCDVTTSIILTTLSRSSDVVLHFEVTQGIIVPNIAVVINSLAFKIDGSLGLRGRIIFVSAIVSPKPCVGKTHYRITQK